MAVDYVSLSTRIQLRPLRAQCIDGLRETEMARPSQGDTRESAKEFVTHRVFRFSGRVHESYKLDICHLIRHIDEVPA
jgi:TFIIF-interacting CTD phosphatase-like protein